MILRDDVSKKQFETTWNKGMNSYNYCMQVAYKDKHVNICAVDRNVKGG